MPRPAWWRACACSRCGRQIRPPCSRAEVSSTGLAEGSSEICGSSVRVFARAVLLLRHGCVAATLRGPPETAMRRAGKSGPRYLDPARVGRHLLELWAQSHWAQGVAPVLLTGLGAAALPAVVAAAVALGPGAPLGPPLGEAARLVTVPSHLSELRTGLPAPTRAWVQGLAATPAAPAFGGHTLCIRCQAALHSVFGPHPAAPLNLPAALDEAGPRGAAFRALQLWS